MPRTVPPDPAALDHLDATRNLVGVSGWALHKDGAAVLVLTDDGHLHINGHAVPLHSSPWRAAGQVLLLLDTV